MTLISHHYYGTGEFCCTGENGCCGAGSWCCGHTPIAHTHEEDE